MLLPDMTITIRGMVNIHKPFMRCACKTYISAVNAPKSTFSTIWEKTDFFDNVGPKCLTQNQHIHQCWPKFDMFDSVDPKSTLSSIFTERLHFRLFFYQNRQFLRFWTKIGILEILIKTLHFRKFWSKYLTYFFQV